MPRATGYTREDKMCICGMQRHSTCPFCKTGMLKTQPGGQLVDHITKVAHICETQPVALNTEVVPTMSDDIRATWQGLIPSMERYQSYIPRQIDGDTDLAHLRLAYANQQNVLLFGPKGAGKNHLTEALAAIERQPIIAVNFSLGTTVEDIVGQMQLINGSTVFKDGALAFCMRYGGIFVGDEINAAPREIAFSLHQATDHRRQLVITQKEGTEVVRAHPKFMFIGTYNPDYAGTRDLNEAFEDRFHLALELDYNDEVEKQLIKDKRLLEMAKRIRNSYHSASDDRVTKTVSTRALLAYEQNIKVHGKEIARKAFVNRWRAGQERIAVEKVHDAIMKLPVA